MIFIVSPATGNPKEPVLGADVVFAEGLLVQGRRSIPG
jgi:hypothetical protein